MQHLQRNLQDAKLAKATRYYMSAPSQEAHAFPAIRTISGLGLPIHHVVMEQIRNVSNLRKSSSDVQSNKAITKDLLGAFYQFLTLADSGNKDERSAKQCQSHLKKILHVVDQDMDIQSLVDYL